ncbi:hypothetical protein BDQ17DRAFT_1332632 [Cyathus striatus]|nr:hypothetical protein BDQ17DRAFT_1332632 [Cyathus striatus]
MGLQPINIDLRCTLQDIVPGGTVNVSWTIPTLMPNEATISLGSVPLAKEGNTNLRLTDFPEDPSGSPVIIATANINSYYGCCSPDPAYENSECTFNPQSRLSKNSPGPTLHTQPSTPFQTTSPLSPTSKNTGLRKGAVVGIIVAIVFILLAALVIGSLYYKARRKSRLSQAPLLTPFNATSRTSQAAPVSKPPQQRVSFDMHDSELPEYPGSVVGTNTTMLEDIPVMLSKNKKSAICTSLVIPKSKLGGR